MVGSGIRVAAAAVAVALAIAGCASASSTDSRPVVPATRVTNEPLAANTPGDVAAAGDALTAYLDANGIRYSRIARPGLSTSDDIPADWFQKSSTKPFKVISFRVETSSGKVLDIPVVRESQSATWAVYIVGN